MLSLDDTIAAIATAAGGAARGMVRISGPQTVDVLKRCFRPDDESIRLDSIRNASVIAGRIERFGAIHKPEWDRFRLPLHLFFWPSVRSYTRQPMAEIQGFGSPPLLNVVLDTVCQAGARVAQPGEFTLRAFLGGRIDLTQAEAVLGVIDADDRRHLEQALNQLAGGFSRNLRRLQSDLLDLLADLEAGLDFVEEDIRFVSNDELCRRLQAAADELESAASQFGSRTTSRDLPRVVLVGEPNVGKSSLFNALVGNDAAIVSPQAGTTRDYVSATLVAGGLAVELIDTAGVTTSDEPLVQKSSIEESAKAAAASQHKVADLQLLCIDASRSLGSCTEDDSTSAILVLTKCDQANPIPSHLSAIQTSSRTGMGLDCLRAAISEALASRTPESAVLSSTAARAGESMRLARDSLSRAVDLAMRRIGDELISAEIRAALAEVGKVVGTVYSEDLLDRIFSRFCIGK